MRHLSVVSCVTAAWYDTSLQRGTDVSLERGNDVSLERVNEASLKRGHDASLKRGNDASLEGVTGALLERGTDASLAGAVRRENRRERQGRLSTSSGAVVGLAPATAAHTAIVGL